MTNPDNWRSIETNIGDRDVELTPENCGIARFRLEEEPKDYLDYWELGETPEETQHWWVFRQKRLFVWMGGAVLEGDVELLQEMEDEYGSFLEMSGGWRPPVSIWDRAQDYENELYTKGLLKDLDVAEGPDDLLAS